MSEVDQIEFAIEMASRAVEITPEMAKLDEGSLSVLMQVAIAVLAVKQGSSPVQVCERALDASIAADAEWPAARDEMIRQTGMVPGKPQDLEI